MCAMWRADPYDCLVTAARMSMIADRTAASTAPFDAALTPDEREVLHLALDGASNKQIAFRLHMSERTVERRRADALRGLGVESLVEAARLAAAPPPASERVVLAAFRESASGLALVDWGGRFAAVNAAYCRVVGRSEAELLRGGLELVTHPDDLSASLAVTGRLFAGEVTEFRVEKRYLRGGGDVVRGRVSAAAVPGSDGRPSLAVAQVVPAAA